MSIVLFHFHINNKMTLSCKITSKRYYKGPKFCSNKTNLSPRPPNNCRYIHFSTYCPSVYLCWISYICCLVILRQDHILVVEKMITDHLNVRVSEWLLFDAKLATFQLCHGENKLRLMRWWFPLCSRLTRLVGLL